jgi:16S rRNA U1498 N3-methylase RsmE
VHRFFLPTVCSREGEFPLSPGDANKICRVLRLRPGLGKRILRTETAGLVGLSLILYEWGDLDGAISA